MVEIVMLYVSIICVIASIMFIIQDIISHESPMFSFIIFILCTLILTFWISEIEVRSEVVTQSKIEFCMTSTKLIVETNDYVYTVSTSILGPEIVNGVVIKKCFNPKKMKLIRKFNIFGRKINNIPEFIYDWKDK